MPGSETAAVYPSMTAFKIFYEVTRIQKALNDQAAEAAEAEKHGDEEPPEEDELGLPKPPPGEAASETAGMPSCVAKQVTRPVRNREARVTEPQLA